jgi:hypothetical protein
MEQIEVIAVRRQVVGNKLYQPGDRFSVVPALANLLGRLHRVTTVESAATETPARPKRTYRRRDVVAE